MSTHIYKLTPNAAEWDPNWDIAMNHGDVIVRAESPADARIVASEAEPDFEDTGGKPAEDGTTREASAFRNIKLYHVSRLNSSSYDDDGPREVLSGEIANPVKSA